MQMFSFKFGEYMGTSCEMLITQGPDLQLKILSKQQFRTIVKLWGVIYYLSTFLNLQTLIQLPQNLLWEFASAANENEDAGCSDES